MKAYFGSRISPNMTETPEGFLVCHNVSIARTGEYKYLGKEIEKDDKDSLYSVYRTPEEVFSEKAIASFQGKIVTDDHPPDLLNPENAQRYCKGTVDNVRRSQKEPDLLLADLIIYDKRLIKEIKEGKREVSCGYEYELLEKDGKLYQTNIIGNHVAIVENGRAGERCKVFNSMKYKGGNEKMSDEKIKVPRKTDSFTNWLAGLGAHYVARDASPEEFNDVLNGLVEEKKMAAKDEEPQVVQQPVVQPQATEDEEEKPNAVEAKLQQLIDVVGSLVQALQPKVAQEKQPEEAIDEMIEQYSKEGCDECGEKSDTVEAEDEGDLTEPESAPVTPEEEKADEPFKGNDSAVQMLKAMKPIVAAIKDPAEKKKACDSLTAEFKKIMKNNKKSAGYAGIIKAQKKTALDHAVETYDANKEAQKVSDMYANMNPHRRGGVK